MTESVPLDQLCERLGILPRYRDHTGQVREVPAETLKALAHRLQPSASDSLLPPVVVLRQGAGPVRIPLAPQEGMPLRWELHRPDGRQTTNASPTDAVELDGSLPLGDHRLLLYGGDAKLAECVVIVAPARAFLPPALQDAGRLWGLATQLFALRSARNWGIGDFTDLLDLIERAAPAGVAAIGLTPLHALFPDEPDRCSPYSPSSRSFLNIVYIDPEAMSEFAACDAARELRRDAVFDAELARLRGTPLVDYAAVTALKLRMFDLLYRHFHSHHLAQDDELAVEFRAFQSAHGEQLRRFAIFQALRAHFTAKSPDLTAWHAWPEEFRDPDNVAVADFAQQNLDRVTFFEYLQWHAHRQLLRCQERARHAGMPIGVYLDIAVGVDGDSAEAWWSQDYLVDGWSIGAPPDNWNLKGQSWGAPPPHALRMRETAYAAFRGSLRANMRASGAIRIDHILGFVRLFWVPEGTSAASGAYVRYPLDDLLAIVALESRNHRCLVIGEDLGTVPDGLQDALHAAGILSYRLLYFEHDEGGRFRKPSDWPSQALVAPSTHDLPTLPAYWSGADLELRTRLDLYPSAEVAEAERKRRVIDRRNLTAALRAEGLPADPDGPAPIESIYRYLARTSSRLLMLQPEDLLGVTEPLNVPGTTGEYPNWRRKLPIGAEAFFSDPSVMRVVEAINAEGRRSPQTGTAAEAIPEVPTATYRLQFSRAFTFADATRLVPYLKALGVSHVYASSYLKARPGSAHGYDIVDHNALNPEIGDWDAFEAFCTALREAGMGQILDFVPNHMGIGHADNERWLDVLEWGRDSPFAAFFDINWSPRHLALHDRIMVPLLGDQYGHVLERGELTLHFEPETGGFGVWYFEHRFPIHPRCYAAILGKTDRELDEIAQAAAVARDAAARSAGLALKRELARRAAASAEERARFDAAAARFKGVTGDPQSFQALHDLLERQVYRLAFWRVAADEINYRRFFDINELAGIRMDNPEVFEETHRLVGQLIAEGKLHGLRLDHIDGLLDPGGYLARLKALAGTHSSHFYIVVEKILARHERLREDWPIAGTTGYEFINLVNGLFVEPDSEQALDRTYRRFLDRSADFDEILYGCKLQVIDTMLASELNRLAAELDALSERHWSTRDYTQERLHAALREVVACFPVYRTYVNGDGASAEDRRDIQWAVSQARKTYAAPDPEILDFVQAALTLDLADWNPAFDRNAVLRFAQRFQQYTGPVTAKSLEDTCFYRYNRLLSLNEVGGDPRQFGVSVAAFHRLNQERAKAWPNALSPAATHDTKRGADLRARLNALSEVATDWNQRVRRWASLNRYKRGKVLGAPAPSPNDEYAIYQTLLGAWPADLVGVAAPDVAVLEPFGKRVQGTVLKSIREAKRRTSWHNPNEGYETACLGFVERVLDTTRPNPFLDDFIAFQARIARIGVLNSLSQLVLALTAPGVPDLYQGCETWDFNMVDPDNRRPVDFASRRRLFEEVAQDAGGHRRQLRDWLEHWQDGRIKIAAVAALLGCRRREPDLFRHGSYEPLIPEGAREHHAVGFARRHAGKSCVVVAGRLFARLVAESPALYPGGTLWGDTQIALPELSGPMTDVLTGAAWPNLRTLRLADILADLPAAVLVSDA